LGEEVAILVEQESLLKEEIARLAEGAQARARREAEALAFEVRKEALREDIASLKKLFERVAEELELVSVERNFAEQRVRLLQKAEAGRPGK
jgi:hypothetical protein